MMLHVCSSSLTQRSRRDSSATPVYPIIKAMIGRLNAHFGTLENAT
jgi:hypothetical protein